MTKTGAAAALDPMLCFAVYSLQRRFGQAYRELLEPWGLSYTQYLTLIALWNEDGLTVGGLGELLGLDSGTLSPLLKRLEGRGLLRRVRSGADERVVRLELTEAGQSLRDELADVQRCFGERTGMTRAQSEDLICQMRSLSATITEGTLS